MAISEKESWLPRDEDQISTLLTDHEEQLLREATNAGKKLFKITIFFERGAFSADLLEFQAKLTQLGKIITTLPVVVEGSDDKIGFEILLATEKTMENIKEVVSLGKSNVKIQPIYLPA